jgi:hypothetical protein
MAVTLNANSSTGFIATSDTSGVLQLQTGGTTAVTVDASQNVGVGVTPSAWNSTSKVLQIGTPLALEAISNASVLFNNTYRNTSGLLKYSTTAASGFYAIDGNVHTWNSAPSGTAGNTISFTQAMTLDASGNLGVGATSPSCRLQVSSTNSTAANNTLTGSWVNVGSSLSSGLGMRQRGDSAGISGTTFPFQMATIGGFPFEIYTADSQPLVFGTAATERARITSGGVFMVGATTAHSFGIPSIQAGGSNGNALISVYRNDTSLADQVIFYNPNGLVGRIQTDGSATAYVTSSDYRLKENITPMTGALSKVALLKPVTYKWKVDGSDSQGFIAHELAEVCPQAVSGEKDAVNEDGSINPQGIDTSFLVATLTAAIQEQQALITQLQADVAALKGASA